MNTDSLTDTLTDSRRVASRPILLVVAALPLLAATARVQDAGTVRLAVRTADGAPLVGAHVTRANAPVTLDSDERGVITVQRVPTGGAWLHVRRLGYRPDSVRVETTSGKTIDATVQMARVAVDLAPVTVTGRTALRGPMAGFYGRQAMGRGRYFTRADLEKRNPASLTVLLRSVPGFRVETRQNRNQVRIRNSRCSPLVWVDGQALTGMEVDLDSFDPMSFDGIEVYSGAASVPLEFQRNQAISSSCGTIVMWSKQPDRAEPSRKRNGPSPAALVLQLLADRKAFADDDVDQAAFMDSMAVVHPLYPDSLFEAQTSGSVLAEFVVTASGAVQIETFSAVTFTHSAFIEPVRKALRDQRFVPAIKQGKAVPHVLQQPFQFVPDSTARRRR